MCDSEGGSLKLPFRVHALTFPDRPDRNRDRNACTSHMNSIDASGDGSRSGSTFSGKQRSARAVERLALEHRRRIRLQLVTRQVTSAPRKSVVGEESTERASHPHVESMVAGLMFMARR